MSDRLATANIDIDPELTPGAHNAVSVCLQLTPEERVTIITDEATWTSQPHCELKSRRSVPSTQSSFWKIIQPVRI
jgi:hypothetical protein